MTWIAGLIVVLVLFAAAWWFATTPPKPGRKPSGMAVMAAVLFGLGRVMDPPQERAVEAARRTPKPDENGEPPLET